MHSATLSLFPDYSWTAPLIVIGIAFFVVGLLMGLLSALPTTVRLRMEIRHLKRDLSAARDTQPPIANPPRV
jgi:uncharacterized integral membrane protein